MGQSVGWHCLTARRVISPARLLEGGTDRKFWPETNDRMDEQKDSSGEDDFGAPDSSSKTVGMIRHLFLLIVHIG